MIGRADDIDATSRQPLPHQFQRRHVSDLERNVLHPARRVRVAAHAAGDAVVGQQPLELLAGILAALVRVMQQRLGFATTPHRHYQSICDELRRHAATHRPADDQARCDR